MNTHNVMMKSAIAIALTSAFGFAQATSVGVSAPAATVGAYAATSTIAAEKLGAAYTVDTSAILFTNGIRWIPTFGLNSGDICTFAFSNALYKSADVKLMGAEAAAEQTNTGAIDINQTGVTTDVVEVASNFGTLDATNGVASVQVRINNGLVLPTNIELTLAKDAAQAEAAGDGVPASATASNPTFIIPANTSAGTAVTVTTSCVTSGNTPIGAAAASNTIMDIANQFNVTLATAATSLVDVGAAVPRTNFLEEGGVGDIETTTNDTDLTRSAAVITVDNDSAGAIEDFVANGELTNVVITLTPSVITGISSVGSFLDWEVAATAGTNDQANDGGDVPAVVGATELTYTIPAAQIPWWGTSATDDLSVGIDGTTLIENRTITGSAVWDITGVGYTGIDRSFSLGQTHAWTTNGTVLLAPWSSGLDDSAPYVSRFLISNTGATAAPYSVRLQNTVNSSGGAMGTPTAGALTSGSIPAGTTVEIRSNEIASFAPSTPKRATVEFTVNAPAANIKGTAQFINTTTGTTTDTTMINTNGAGSGH